jgi:hypothetical protein
MNEHRGESSITLDGKTYELRLTTNRLAHLEAVLDCRGGLSGRLLGGGSETTRAVLHVCLTVPLRKGMRPAIRPPFTLEDMGELMDAEGGLVEKGPITYAYWELLCNSGVADREMAEKAGLVLPRKGPKDAGQPAAVEPEEDAAIASI